MTRTEFTHLGRTYTVLTDGVDGEVLAIKFAVRIEKTLQPHTQQRRLHGDKLYEVARAFRSARKVSQS